MVEKNIHQIWVGDFKIPHREAFLAERLRELHPEYNYRLWTDEEVKLEIDFLPEKVKLWYDRFYANKNYVFCADLLRVYLIYKYGGFYLDIDFDIKERLDPFFVQDGCLFYHNDTDFTIPNNLICMKSSSPILKFCIDQVNEHCSWYGPSWLGMTVKNYLRLPYEIAQQHVADALKPLNVDYFQYYAFETSYGRHLSLYSWEPKTWEKLNKGEQL